MHNDDDLYVTRGEWESFSNKSQEYFVRGMKVAGQSVLRIREEDGSFTLERIDDDEEEYEEEEYEEEYEDEDGVYYE